MFLSIVPAMLADLGPAPSLRVVAGTAPPGGWAQIQVFSNSPWRIADGALSIDFDPAVFGTIDHLAVFSAAGDAAGWANVKDRHLDVHFSSRSSGIGQLPQVPIFVVSLPVLATATAGAATLTVDPSATPWHDVFGKSYTLSMATGVFTVGGGLSIQSLTPGGGVLPAGTVVEVSGTGLDAATGVTIDGVRIESTQFVSGEVLRVTLGSQTELTGKHVQVAGAGSSADYFSALSSAPTNAPSDVHLILPLTTYAAGLWKSLTSPAFTDSVVVQNQNNSPAVIHFFCVDPGQFMVFPDVNIPPGGMYFGPKMQLGLCNTGATASIPVRLMEYRRTRILVPSSPVPETAIAVYPPTPTTRLSDFFHLSLSPQQQAWSWQVGTPPPASWSLSTDGPTPFKATVSASAASWLTVTQGQNSIVLTPSVAGLQPGGYSGTVSIQPVVGDAFADLVNDAGFLATVSLQVSLSPFVNAYANGEPRSTSFRFSLHPGDAAPPPVSLTVVSSGSGVPYNVAAQTKSGGNWLSVTPSTGVTPGTLQMRADPSGLAAGTYLGQVSISGPANTAVFPVELYLDGPATGFFASPAALSFVVKPQTGAPLPQCFFVNALGEFSISAIFGGKWLLAEKSGIGVCVNVNSAGLAVGVYQGAVTVSSGTYGTLVVPIMLTVLGPGAQFTASPPSVTITTQVGQHGRQSIALGMAAAAVPFSLQILGGTQQAIFAASVVDGAGQAQPAITPATVLIDALPAEPGVFHATLQVTSSVDSILVPITVLATAVAPPVVANIVDAASGVAGSFAPGEIITLYGVGIGSGSSSFALDSQGKVPNNINNTVVRVNGLAAPLLYVGSGQVNAIVPFEVTAGNAAVDVFSNGLPAARVEVPVAPAAPSVFTVGSAGTGQAAVLNQDNSVNSATNPAAKGTIIQIFGTGGGATAPAGVTGGITRAPNMTLLPVTVNIGGSDAAVTYHGGAPGAVEGFLQVNAVVPTVAPGPAVPISLTIGGVRSAAGVTVAVK